MNKIFFIIFKKKSMKIKKIKWKIEWNILLTINNVEKEKELKK